MESYIVSKKVLYDANNIINQYQILLKRFVAVDCKNFIFLD